MPGGLSGGDSLKIVLDGGVNPVMIIMDNISWKGCPDTDGDGKCNNCDLDSGW